MTIKPRSILAIVSFSIFLSCGGNEPKATTAETPPTMSTSPTTAETAAASTAEAPKPQITETDGDQRIGKIKTALKVTDSKLDSYEKRILEVRSTSGSPMKVIGYYDKKGPVKITTEETLTTGVVNYAYYLQDEKLIFAQENRQDEASSYTAQESRTYIQDGQVIQALEKKGTFNSKNEVNMANVETVNITKDIIGEKVLLTFEGEIKKWRAMMERK